MWVFTLLVASSPFTDAGMNFYALSFDALAQANVGQPATAQIKAMQTPSFRARFTGTKSDARRGESAIYAGHVLMAQLASGAPVDHALALELAHHVKPGLLLPSYVQHPRRLWPADNEVALAALRLYAQRFPDEDDVVRAAERLEATLDKFLQDGLPASEVDPVTLKQLPPRGCAIGLTILMRGYHDLETAAALYAQFREQFWQTLPMLAGFREYEGSGNADADSGPIVFGIGASASAFGMAAANLVHQQDDYVKLSRSATVAMRVLLNQKERDSLLARAIIRYAATLRRS